MNLGDVFVTLLSVILSLLVGYLYAYFNIRVGGSEVPPLLERRSQVTLSSKGQTSAGTQESTQQPIPVIDDVKKSTEKTNLNEREKKPEQQQPDQQHISPRHGKQSEESQTPFSPFTRASPVININTGPLGHNKKHWDDRLENIEEGIAKYPDRGVTTRAMIRNKRGQGTGTSPSPSPHSIPPLLNTGSEITPYSDDEKIPPPDVVDPKDLPVAQISNRMLQSGPHRGRLVIVSYRLPLSITKTEKGWQVKWNDPRDLLANMRMLDREYSVQFVGWPGVDVKEDEQEELDDKLQQLEHPCYAVYLDAKTREEFHNEFCKGILWPLFHYVMPTSHFDQSRKYEALWRVYQNVNMLFAKKASVATDNEEDAIIWFHSYHLLTAPNFLRKSRPTAQIGFFFAYRISNKRSISHTPNEN